MGRRSYPCLHPSIWSAGRGDSDEGLFSKCSTRGFRGLHGFLEIPEFVAFLRVVVFNISSCGARGF